jgi:hypothetical protein
VALATLGLTLGTGASATVAAPISHATIVRTVHSKNWPGVTTNNWSGYGGVTSGTNTVTYTSATWTVPSVQATTGFSSTWVGVDGFNNSHLIQTGTEQDYTHGKFVYRAWWEILPARETRISSLAISPGDRMNGVVQKKSGTSWLISLTDLTTGKSFSTTQTYNGPGTSAEWIQEAPSGARGVLKLAVYAETEFSSITLGLNGGTPTALTLLFPSEAIAMVRGRKQISTPSKPTGNSFNVAYGPNQPAAP